MIRVYKLKQLVCSLSYSLLLLLLLPRLHHRLVPPNAASVVLGASNDGVSFVVEGAGKDFVLVSI